MEVLGLIGSAAGFGAAAITASGGGRSRHASGWGMRQAVRRIEAVCALVGDTRTVAMLVRMPSWRELSDVVARRLRLQGVHVAREDACALAVLASLAASLALGIFARSPYGIVVGVLGTPVMVSVWYSSRKRRRERALVDEMPEVFRTLAMALGSGETLTQAIEYVGVHERGYAGSAFVQAALRLRCGASTEEAMAQLSRDLDAPGVGLLTTALVIAQRTGSPLRGLFQSSAQLVERQGEYERMLSVKTAQVRLSIRIVCLLPLLLVGLLSLISIDFQNGLSTLPGTLSILLAAAMDGLALFVIRHLMRGVL